MYKEGLIESQNPRSPREGRDHRVSMSIVRRGTKTRRLQERKREEKEEEERAGALRLSPC